jgi:hypothetical protein
MVHDACLFVLQVHASSFGISWQGEMLWHKEAFHRLGVQDVAQFNSDCCSVFCLFGEKNRKEKGPEGFFFPGPDTPCWLCCMGFSWLLGGIKG